VTNINTIWIISNNCGLKWPFRLNATTAIIDDRRIRTWYESQWRTTAYRMSTLRLCAAVDRRAGRVSRWWVSGGHSLVTPRTTEPRSRAHIKHRHKVDIVSTIQQRCENGAKRRCKTRWNIRQNRHKHRQNSVIYDNDVKTSMTQLFILFTLHWWAWNRRTSRVAWMRVESWITIYSRQVVVMRRSLRAVSSLHCCFSSTLLSRSMLHWCKLILWTVGRRAVRSRESWPDWLKGDYRCTGRPGRLASVLRRAQRSWKWPDLKEVSRLMIIKGCIRQPEAGFGKGCAAVGARRAVHPLSFTTAWSTVKAHIIRTVNNKQQVSNG
jgi:hypothetical protein